jgi:tetratricopeptide (TPR) repeat protein
MVLGRDYYFARDYDRAIAQLQKTITINPRFQSAYWHLGNAFLQKKLYTRAIDTYTNPNMPARFETINRTMLLSIAYAASGDKIRAKDSLASIPKEDYLRIDPVLIAQFYATMGNFDEALKQLERGFDIHTLNMIALMIDPFLDPLRNEPRFKALLKKMNFQ